MMIKTLSALAVATVAFSSPVFAQDMTVDGAAQKPAHALRHVRNAYNQAPGYDFSVPRAGQYLESEEIRPGEPPYANVPGN